MTPAVDAVSNAIEALSPQAEDTDEPEALEETMRQLERAVVKAKPTESLAASAKELAERALTMGNYERAHRLYERALLQKAVSESLTPEEWNRVARARVETDDFRGAAQAFMRAGNKVSDDVYLLGSALPTDDVPLNGGWAKRCVPIDVTSKKRCKRQWLACFVAPSKQESTKATEVAAVIIEAKTLRRFSRDPTTTTAAKNSAWVREWAAAAPTPTTRKGELLTSLKTIDIDVCTSSVIEMKSRFEDNGSRATFFERREIRPLTP